jgi:hypothetical protein
VRLETYAEIFSADHPMMQEYRDGFKKTPGRLLREYLEESGGSYEVVLEMPIRLRESVRRLAERNGDAEMAAIAKIERVRISLEHLRGYDPDTTRIVVGTTLHAEPGDGELEPFDS